MKITTESAREILNADLTDSQVARGIESATADAEHWTAEATAGTLPEIDTMQLDWSIDEDLRKAGVDSYAMQRLSFAIAKS